MSNVLHYRGDRTDFDPDRWVGPDVFGGYCRPIGADYDAATDRTAITFSPVAPAELRARWEAEAAKIEKIFDSYATYNALAAFGVALTDRVAS